MVKSINEIMYIVSYFPSTSQTFVLREIKELKEQGIKVKILALRASDKEIKHKDTQLFINDTKYIPDFGRKKSNLIKLVRGSIKVFLKKPIKYITALTKAIGTGRARVILDFLRAGWVISEGKIGKGIHLHAHFAHNPTNIAYFIHLLNGNTFSFTSHAVDLYVKPVLLKEKLMKSSFSATISNYNKDLLLNKYGSDAVKNLYIIRCGIERSTVENAKSNKIKKDDETKVTILTIGRMVEKKGFDVLIRALSLLKKRGFDFECRIIGGGELESNLIHDVKINKLENNVLFLGAKSSDEVQKEFSTADMFVLPCKKAANGDMDGIPVVYMEAIANKVPVIATRLSGIPELIIDGETGLLAEPDDAESLVNKLEYLFKNPILRMTLPEKAIAHLINEFLLEDNVDELSNLFEIHLEGRSK